MNKAKIPLDFARVRELLEGARGRDYWRSLEEIAGTEEFEELLHREFPRQASEWPEGNGRRNFLKLMAASLSLAGLSACTRQPKETIMPYVQSSEEVIPGKPLFYATAVPVGGIAEGVLVESHLGRSTKVAGNPLHSGSLGATNVVSQASVLSLDDPDRSQAISYRGEIGDWGSFLAALSGLRGSWAFQPHSCSWNSWNEGDAGLFVFNGWIAQSQVDAGSCCGRASLARDFIDVNA